MLMLCIMGVLDINKLRRRFPREILSQSKYSLPFSKHEEEFGVLLLKDSNSDRIWDILSNVANSPLKSVSSLQDAEESLRTACDEEIESHAKLCVIHDRFMNMPTSSLNTQLQSALNSWDIASTSCTTFTEAHDVLKRDYIFRLKEAIELCDIGDVDDHQPQTEKSPGMKCADKRDLCVGGYVVYIDKDGQDHISRVVQIGPLLPNADGVPEPSGVTIVLRDGRELNTLIERLTVVEVWTPDNAFKASLDSQLLAVQLPVKMSQYYELQNCCAQSCGRPMFSHNELSRSLQLSFTDDEDFKPPLQGTVRERFMLACEYTSLT